MKVYSYPCWVIAVSVAYAVWAIVAGMLMVVLSLDVLISGSYRLIPDGWEVVTFRPWWGLAAGLFFLAMSMLAAACSNTIVVTETGIKVKTFHLLWRFIPWDEIEGLVPLTNPYTGVAKTHIIKVRQLTVIHRLIGLSRLTEFTPVLLIQPHIRQRCELLETIRSHGEGTEGIAGTSTACR